MAAVDAPMTSPPLSDGSRPSMSLKRQSLTNGGGLAAPLADADAMSVNSMVDVEARCGGCRKLIDQENGGIVVQFGTSYWHVDCFRCAKCQQQVSADTNLLLLSDGSPVCGNCSYQCFVCKQSITEEAIMTGDESYHAHCFTCRTCKRRIEELVFAKTTQGIYCMSCHNERVARSRRHAEAKRQRAARKEREREEAEARKREGSGTLSHSTTSTSLNVLSNFTKSPTDSSPANSPVSIKGPDRKSSLPPLSPHQQQSPRNTPEHRPRELSVDRSMGASSPTARAPSPSTSRMGTSINDRSMPSSPALDGPSLDVSTSTRATLSPSPRPQSPLSGPSVSSVPLQASPSVPNLMSPSPRNDTPRTGGSPALGVPSTRSERRRSINPGLMFNMDAQNATFAAEPRAPSPLRGSDVPNSTTPTLGSTTPGAATPAPGESKDASLSVPKQPSAPQTPQIRSRSTTPVGDERGKERKASASAIPTPELSAEKGAEGEPGTMPRIDAPNLPTMSFSLSDPDFAMLLKSPGQAQTAKLPTANAQEVEVPRPNGNDVSPNHLSPKDGSGLPPAGTLRRRGSVDSFISVRLAPDSAFSLLKECMAETKGDKVPVDREILNDLVREYQSLRDAALTLKTKYTGAKRSSQQYSEGLTIAGEEYDKEVAARRDLEAENIRLRAQVHSQTARLSVISSDERRAENMRRRSQDLASSLSTLERDISRLRAQRDISLAEMEELQTKSVSGNAEETTSKLSRSLTRRLDTIKEQYKDELGPLSAQREVLQREINDLRDMREHFLEESTSLAAKNEEIAELNTQLSRQMEVMQDALARRSPVYTTALKTGPPPPGQPRLPSHSSHPSGSPSMSSLATALQDVPEETAATVRVVKVSKPEMEAAPARRFKWMGGKSTPKTPEVSNPKPLDGGRDRKFRPSTEMGMRDHHFQQHSTMRLGRCELCQDKMWGLQEVKCASCGVVCHSKCADKLPKSCPGKTEGDEGPLPPTMFGRDLTEQAAADGLAVPVIVTKCIGAVEANGMEYEGIYRKTGGSSQSKQITQLFEKGRYDTFDLNDVEAFNDISSITSVLKTYFRQLPDPLMTHALHESFVAAANIRDPNNKNKALTALLKELPRHHYDTLKILMLHLNRVTSKSSSNLMTSQNLGVVFGPTLLRSKDPGREFGDMAGKALTVQWMVDHAPTVFLDDEREPRANGE